MDRRRRVMSATAAAQMTSGRPSQSASSGVLPVPPPKPTNGAKASGAGMLGKPGASWFVPPLKRVPIRTATKYVTTTRPTHLHRLLGRRPSGKSSATTISTQRLINAVQPPTNAGHSTQPVDWAPLSTARIAPKVVTRLIACTTATTIRSHPIACRGRRETMRTPSGAITAALRKLESSALSGDLMTRQSSATSTRLISTDTPQNAPIAHASRTAARSVVTARVSSVPVSAG